MAAAAAAGLRSGLSASVEHVVTAADTAAALGSGNLPVLGSPRLLAWLEAATCAAIAPYVGEADSSVGTRMNLEHVRASPVGATVIARCELVHVDGRLLRFQVEAAQIEATQVEAAQVEAAQIEAAQAGVGAGAAPAAGVVVAHGEITRIIVATARFLARSALA